MPVPSGSLRDVDVHRAGERVGDDQRRRGEVVRAHVLLDAAFEVAVAAQHRRDDEAALVDLRRNLVRQRTAVADAGRAAVADEVEAKLIEIRVEAGLLQVVGDDLRSGREAGLDPRLARQALLHRLLRDQARADHHARVRGVRAAGDRGDHDRAVFELRRGRDARCHRRRPATFTPFFSSSSAPANDGLAFDSGTRSCGRRGPARLGSTDRQIELHRLAVDRIRRVGRSEQALRLRVGLDERDLLRVAAGEAQVIERHVVDREDRDRGAVLRAHVAERHAIGNRQVRQARTEELDELADDALLADALR